MIISIFIKNGRFIIVDSENNEEITTTAKMKDVVAYITENFEAEYSEEENNLFNFARNHQSLANSKITKYYHELDDDEQQEILAQVKSSYFMENGIGENILADLSEAEY